MKFFAPNINRSGRMARAIFAALLLLAGLLVWPRVRSVAIVLFLFCALAVFQALRGWCVMRACGIKTKM
jgi:hypothetical protein